MRHRTISEMGFLAYFYWEWVGAYVWGLPRNPVCKLKNTVISDAKIKNDVAENASISLQRCFWRNDLQKSAIYNDM